MSKSDTSAERIVQDLLDRSSAAMVEGDYDAFASFYNVPMIVDTFNGQVRIENDADLRLRFERLRAHYGSQNMTDLVRHVISAIWFNEETIHATHQGRIVSGSTLMQAPYTVFSIFKKSGGSWKVMFGQYAIADSKAHNAALLATPSPQTGEHND